MHGNLSKLKRVSVQMYTYHFSACLDSPWPTAVLQLL